MAPGSETGGTAVTPLGPGGSSGPGSVGDDGIDPHRGSGEAAFAERRYVRLKQGMVTALTVYMTALVVATAWVLFWGPG